MARSPQPAFSDSLARSRQTLRPLTTPSTSTTVSANKAGDVGTVTVAAEGRWGGGTRFTQNLYHDPLASGLREAEEIPAAGLRLGAADDVKVARRGTVPISTSSGSARKHSSCSPSPSSSLALPPTSPCDSLSNPLRPLSPLSASPTCCSPRAMLNPGNISGWAEPTGSNSFASNWDGSEGRFVSACQDANIESHSSRPRNEGASGKGFRAWEGSGAGSANQNRRKQPSVGVGMAALSLVTSPSSKTPVAINRGNSDDARGYQRHNSLSPSPEGQVEFTQSTESAALLLKQASSFWLVSHD